MKLSELGRACKLEMNHIDICKYIYHKSIYLISTKKSILSLSLSLKLKPQKLETHTHTKPNNL